MKLVDFGIAKTFDESTQLTAAGYMLGTPHYMSPEQAAGKPVDHRADLYSLGVILYEMLTGEVPFGDAALTSVLVRLATEVPPPPSARRPDRRVPPALDAVAMRCLEKDPERRFQSADEFADALERAFAEIERQPAMPGASIPTVEDTLVRPADPRQFATVPAESGERASSCAPARWARHRCMDQVARRGSPARARRRRRGDRRRSQTVERLSGRDPSLRDDSAPRGVVRTGAGTARASAGAGSARG